MFDLFVVCLALCKFSEDFKYRKQLVLSPTKTRVNVRVPGSNKTSVVPSVLWTT